MWIEASAPSNIALIKYMGKTDQKKNQPCNSSISYTLDKLKTFVRIKKDENLTTDEWAPLIQAGLRPINISEEGKKKFLKHFDFLKSQLNIAGYFYIESANNFPSDCGLASSASSFAALTRAAYTWAQQSTPDHSPLNQTQLALLSKLGSGSSCRSFFSPWSLWAEDSVRSLELPMGVLQHQVVLCDETKKLVSSSQAHVKVLTSDLFQGRPERAEKRSLELIKSFQQDDWKKAFEICWDELWDMHLLFHTSHPPFMYMNAGSQDVLIQLLNYWQKNNDGPLVTMDAGSNVHLLFRTDQKESYHEILALFSKNYALWTDGGYVAKK